MADVNVFAGSEIDCIEPLAEILRQRMDHDGMAGMHSVGGWHSLRQRLGEGPIGAAMLARIQRAATVRGGSTCWANVLPPGASYGEHKHAADQLVAVWFLTDGAPLFVAGTRVECVPGRLAIFPGDAPHWVPVTDVERVTVAANFRGVVESQQCR